PMFVNMSDIEPQAVTFLWGPYMPFGKVTMLEGDPGLGKSWLTMCLAAAVSRGRELPGQSEPIKGRVLIMSAEDGLADTIRPRLDALKANVNKIRALSSPVVFDETGIIDIEAEIEMYKPKLVIVD